MEKSRHGDIRKLLAIILAICMCLFITACSTDEYADEDDYDDEYSEEYDQEYDNTDHSGDITGFGSFETTDIYGNVVTDDIFSRCDITIVNIWGTFCGPCIYEMPDLEQLSNDLPSNAQLICITEDVYSNDSAENEDAVSIIEDAGVTFPCLINCPELAEYTNMLMYVPTTFIVDSEGNVIGGPIVGADVPAYRAAAEEIIGEF